MVDTIGDAEVSDRRRGEEPCAYAPEVPATVQTAYSYADVAVLDYGRIAAEVDREFTSRGLKTVMEDGIACALWARSTLMLGRPDDALHLSQLAAEALASTEPTAALYEGLFQAQAHLRRGDAAAASAQLARVRPLVGEEHRALFLLRVLALRTLHARGLFLQAGTAAEALHTVAYDAPSLVYARGIAFLYRLLAGSLTDEDFVSCYDIEANDPARLAGNPALDRALRFTRAVLALGLATRGEASRAADLLPDQDADPASYAAPYVRWGRIAVLLIRNRLPEAYARIRAAVKEGCRASGTPDAGVLIWLEVLTAVRLRDAADVRGVAARFEHRALATCGTQLQGRALALCALWAADGGDFAHARLLMDRAHRQTDRTTSLARFLGRAVEGLQAAHEGRVEEWAAQWRGQSFAASVPKTDYFVVAQLCNAVPSCVELLVLVFGTRGIPAAFFGLLDDGAYRRGSSGTPELLDGAQRQELLLRYASVQAVGAHRGESAAPVPAERPYRIRLLGTLEMHVGTEKVDLTRWRRSKARELFIAVALEAEHDVARERLIDLLWPESDSDKARNCYYVTWSHMKRALAGGNPDIMAAPPLGSSGPRCFVDARLCEVDVVELLAAVTAARMACGRGDFAQAVTYYQRVSDLYRGDVLPGDTGIEWLAAYREHYHTLFIESMVAATEACIAYEDITSAIYFIERALQLEKCREVIYELAMRAYLAGGRREDAITVFHACRTYLKEELGLDPSERICALYREAIAA